MRIKVLLGLAILLFLIFWAATSIYPDWLWFKNLGFAPVFSTMLASRFGFGAAIWFFLALILVANFLIAGRLSRRAGARSPSRVPGGEVPLFDLEQAEAEFWAENRPDLRLMESSVADSSEMAESVTITLRIDPRMLARIKRLARSRYLNYQSMIKQWLSERMEHELRER